MTKEGEVYVDDLRHLSFEERLNVYKDFFEKALLKAIEAESGAIGFQRTEQGDEWNTKGAHFLVRTKDQQEIPFHISAKTVHFGKTKKKFAEAGIKFYGIKDRFNKHKIKPMRVIARDINRIIGKS